MERIQVKLAYIKEQVADIRDIITNKKQQEILSNKWFLKGIKYSLQTAIEAQIDIAYHLAAKRFSRAPLNAREAFVILMENQIISELDLDEYSAMIGFRNRVVHGYQKISNERLIEMTINELQSFETFIKKIEDFAVNPKK